MRGSDKHCCKLCGEKTLEIFGYTPALSLWRVKEDGVWKEVSIRICPRCGYIQGEINDSDRED